MCIDICKGKLGSWAANNASIIYDLNSISALGAFMEVGYLVKEDVIASESFHLHCLVQLNQNDGSLSKSAEAFHCSYDYW